MMSRQHCDWTLVHTKSGIITNLRMEGPALGNQVQGRILRGLTGDKETYCIPDPGVSGVLAWEWKQGFGWLPWYTVTIFQAGELAPP